MISERRQWGHHKDAGFLIVNIWWIWSLVYSNTFNSLQRQYLLEWKNVSQCWGSVSHLVPKVPRPSGQWGRDAVTKWLTGPAQSRVFNRFLGKLCCCGFEGTKSGLQWHQNNFIMLFITSSVFHTSEHLLRDGHVNTAVNQAQSIFMSCRIV